MTGKDPQTKILLFLYAASLAAMIYFYWQGADSSIDWKVTAHAESSEFSAYNFQKGPFQFSIPGELYTLTESFSAGPIERYFTRDAILIGVTWLGMLLILTLATFLPRIWFTGVAGLFIFMLISLKLPGVGIFGFDAYSYWGNLVLIVLFIAPSYAFHSYLKHTRFWVRFGVLIAATVMVILTSGVEFAPLLEQVNVGLYYSVIVIMLVFLLAVAEENIFAILYLITRNRGGENNEKHFSVFSLIYLGLLGLVYSKKSGLIKMELPFFDPYLLLLISAVVAVWSIRHKRILFENILSENRALQLLMATGLTVFAYLALAFSRGNDPVFEGLHYFIVYTHLGMGVLFFLYIIVNFINPLIEGLQIYKVAYKERNLPYVTARIGGLVAIAAFFFVSDKEPFKLFKAGHFNFLGEQAEVTGEKGLAMEYYRKGSIYGHDNHFSNYKLAYHNLQRGKIEEANHKFGRATLRYPTPQAFVNQASTYGMLNEVTPSIVALQEGLLRYPQNNTMLNNLGLTYADLGNPEKARQYFNQANEKSGWNKANKVNLWRLGLGENAEEDFIDGNLPVKANILAYALMEDKNLPVSFNPDDLKSSYPLHKNAFLINGAWYFHSDEVNDLLAEMALSPLEESIYQSSLHTLAIAGYKQGEVNKAIKGLDQLTHQANAESQAKYYNELGLICMEQNAPLLADKFFLQSIAAGSSDAPLNHIAALLEAGKVAEALENMKALANADSSYQNLLSDFTVVFDGENLSTDQLGLKVYYQPLNYSPAELVTIIPELNGDFIGHLWKKISFQLMETRQYNLLEDYLSVFRDSLQPDEYQDCLAIIALTQNLNFSGDHPVAKALNSTDSVRNELLFQEALKNALNTPLVLAVSDYLLDKDIHKSYTLLVEAIDIYPNNVELLKAYCIAALESHLPHYAEPVLGRLSETMAASAYAEFAARYESRKKEIDEMNAEW
ncbi:MAG: hypothetical protein ABJ004_16855 [Cyclobacteriaceae bacterium]